MLPASTAQTAQPEQFRGNHPLPELARSLALLLPA